MKLDSWTIETPVTPWSVIVDGDVVVASGFCALADLVERLPEGSGSVTEVTASGVAYDAVEAYLAGDAAALDAVSVRQPGGPFQQEVWLVMRDIPPGQTWSYADLAS